MSHTLQDLTERLLNAAKKSGADDADAMAIQGQSLSINVRGGQLEQAERAEGRYRPSGADRAAASQRICLGY